MQSISDLLFTFSLYRRRVAKMASLPPPGVKRLAIKVVPLVSSGSTVPCHSAENFSIKAKLNFFLTRAQARLHNFTVGRHQILQTVWPRLRLFLSSRPEGWIEGDRSQERCARPWKQKVPKASLVGRRKGGGGNNNKEIIAFKREVSNVFHVGFIWSNKSLWTQ